MYTLEDVYKTFPSGCTEDFLRVFEMGKQSSENRIAELEQENKVLSQNLEDIEIVNKALKKENAELKSLKDVADLIRLNNSHIVAMAQLNNNNVALRKENAELTDELKALRESIKDYGAGCYENGLRNGKRKLGEQFTKAKEIIREFVEWATWQGSNCPNFKSIQDKAEQFLKESE